MKFSRILITFMTFIQLNANDASEIARTIYSGLPTHADEYVKGVVAGLESADPSTPHRDLPDLHPTTIEWLALASSNLDAANKLMTLFSSDPYYSQRFPDMLFTRTLSPGDGGYVRENTSVIEISGSICLLEVDHSATCIADLEPQSFAMQNLIPGLAHGIIGMQIGESREIVIHPALAYGWTSNFEPNRVLRARITLHSTDGESTLLAPLAPLPPIPFTHSDIQLMFTKAGITDGRHCLRHYGTISDRPPFSELASALLYLHECENLSDKSAIKS